jgi:hypothetical protein
MPRRFRAGDWCPGGFQDAGQVPHLAVSEGFKSLLVLFFRKEHALPFIGIAHSSFKKPCSQDVQHCTAPARSY